MTLESVHYMGAGILLGATGTMMLPQQGIGMASFSDHLYEMQMHFSRTRKKVAAMVDVWHCFNLKSSSSGGRLIVAIGTCTCPQTPPHPPCSRYCTFLSLFGSFVVPQISAIPIREAALGRHIASVKLVQCNCSESVFDSKIRARLGNTQSSQTRCTV